MKKKTRNGYLRLLAWGIAAVVLALDMLFLFMPARDYSAMENRNLQTFPQLSWQRVRNGRFEAQFEDYVEDQFPARNFWISFKSGIDRFLGRTESNGVFLGKDGYLVQNFTEPTEENYARTLNALADFSARHADLRQSMLLVPSALTICRDKLPSHAIAGDENGYISRMQADLSSGSAIRFIDVREDLKAQAAASQLYYRTDHHWTTDAAYLAYLRLAAENGLTGAETAYERKLISDSFSGTLSASSGFRLRETDEINIYLQQTPIDHVVSYPESDAAGKFSSVYWTKNLSVRDQYTLFFDGNHPLVRIETAAAGKRALLVVKDSYANCFVPFLIPDYKKLVMVDPRYYTGDLETLMAAEGITDVLFLYNATTLATDTALWNDLSV